MTNIGYDNIINKIKERTISLPETPMTANDLNIWINATSICQEDILDLIEDMKYGSE